MMLFNDKYLNIVKRISKACVGKCLSINVEISAKLTVGEERDEIVRDNF